MTLFSVLPTFQDSGKYANALLFFGGVAGNDPLLALVFLLLQLGLFLNQLAGK